MKLDAPEPNRIALSESQSANQWIYEMNSRGCLNEGARNQPIERQCKIGNSAKQSFSHVRKYT